MNPLYGAALLALVFVGSHVGLATGPLRSRLVARLGEWGFRILFFAVAALSFTAVVAYYADHRHDGGPGLALSTSPGWGWVLESLVVTGLTLMVAGFWTYSDSPYDLDRPAPSPTPRGLERITRHPFFVGVVLFAAPHALLATRMIGAVLMLALAALAVIGSVHQDAKLLRQRGKPFADYLAVTSSGPFAAILAGRQRLVWGELPFGGLVFGVALAAFLRRVHESIFAYHGAWVILVVVGGTTVLTAVIALRAYRRSSRFRTGAARAGAPS